MERWSPGDAIAWRCRIRTPWGAKDDISYVFPMTVVRERWISWRPDPAWPLATLPDGWDKQ